MPSIRQNYPADVSPDFRNLGITARALVSVNLLALAFALLQSADPAKAVEAFVQSTVLIEPPLLATLALLYALAPWLLRRPFWQSALVATALALAFAAVTHLALGPFAAVGLLRALALTALASALVLGYLHLHTRAYSPALAEARLQALEARIRPHFFFNSLNAVLALIRHDARRAERALEDLADLFRALMSDGRRLVRLADEIALVERYVAIEQLRLGDRLRISWELDGAPVDALLPQFVLQPLLENAIYHGVEPGIGVGDVLVRIERRGERVLVRIENPYHAADGESRGGNQMALDNIRERLMLYFDAEARLASSIEGGRYRVKIDIPYRAGAA
jgi:two-component system sensor histidine kinase AlgZ